jgi:hypothetical protein
MGAVTGIITAGLGAANAIAGAVKSSKQAKAAKLQAEERRRAGMKSPEQLQMEKQSLQNYQRQQQLATEQEASIGKVDAMRDPAIQAYLDQISGKAFQSTPEELANINNLRNAMVQMGMQDVNQFTEQGLTQATSGAAARGLRGQAMGALRGDVLQQAQRQVGGISNQANVFAAQQAIQNPYSRVAAQQGALQQGLTYGNNLRQQAMANRQALQSPFLLQQLQAERTAALNSAAPDTSGGGFFGGLTGGVAGLGAGIGTAANLGKSFQDLQGMGMFGGGSSGTVG